MSQRSKLVRAPTAYSSVKNKLVTASSFTSGSVRTYFGPGHNEFTPGSYTNPTAWRPQGSILRMPQVVWLSCHMPYASWDPWYIVVGSGHETTRDPLEPGESWNPWLGVWNGGSGYFRSSGYMDGVWNVPNDYCENFWAEFPYANQAGLDVSASIFMDGVSVGGWVDDQAFYTARSDLDTVFQSVKSSIESIRSGKTWVYVNHWWFTGLPQFDTCTHLIAPPSDVGYVGTDFLHMYFGLVAYQGTSWDPSPGLIHGSSRLDTMNGSSFRQTPWTEPEPNQGNTTVIKTAVHDASVARVQAAYDRFAGFRVMLYGTDVPLDIWDNVLPDPVSYSNVTDAHTAFLQAEATDLSSYGYTYEGMGTGITATEIKNKIADHFGFNPSTGADL